MKRSETNSWKIEHECPQCGGPVILEETDRLFSCSYCRVRLYLLAQDYFRYYLPPSQSFSKDVVFAPYWRFKGTAFICRARGIEYALNDVSSLATCHPFLPGSLGFRPQTLRLKFLSLNQEGRMFPCQVPLAKLTKSIEKRYHLSKETQTPGPVFHRTFIGESISLIYSPMFIQGNKFYDAILGKPVASIPKDFVDDLVNFHQEKNGNFRFVSTLCPECGWDLLGERDSVVLFCKHCNSVWQASKSGLEKVDFGMLPTQEKSASYLPFWRMETTIQELRLQSYADLLRLANAPVLMKREWEESTFYFWAPAFKLSPGPFLRSAQALTLSEPEQESERELPGLPLVTVNLPSTEAAETIKVTLARIAIDKMRILPKLSEIDIEVRKCYLIFLPFILVGNELVQSRTRLCIHKNALRLGRHL